MKSGWFRIVALGVLFTGIVWLVRWTRFDEQFFSDPATLRADTGYDEVSIGMKPPAKPAGQAGLIGGGGESNLSAPKIIRARPDQRAAWSRGVIRLRFTALTYATPGSGTGNGAAARVRAYHDVNQQLLAEPVIRQWTRGIDPGAFEWNGRFPKIRFAFEVEAEARADTETASEPEAVGFRVGGMWLFDSRTHVRIAPSEYESAAGEDRFVLTCDLWKWHSGPVDLFVDLTTAARADSRGAVEEGLPAEDPSVRFWFHLPNTPGLPASNRGLNNLFQITVPQVRLTSVRDHRRFLSRALQLEFRGQTDPVADRGMYPLDRESISLRELMIAYTRLYPEPPRIEIRQREGIVLLGGDGPEAD